MKGKQLIVFLGWALLAVGCDTGVPTPRPDNIIEEPKMVLILTDMHLIEGARMGRRMIGDSLNLDTYYQKIFDKYNISRDLLDSSFTYYSKKPEIMNQLYEQVIDNINALEIEQNPVKQNTPADSLIMD